MKKQRKGIDMISQLPDELLIRILSLLPAADVTRSRILSNRWKHLWAFLPTLHIVMPKFEEQANRFINSVDQILALRAGLAIQKFFIKCFYMPALLIVNQGSGVLVKPEVEITFPRLKKLNLHCIAFFDTNSLTNLLSRCPVLEELCLDTQNIWLNRNLLMVKLSSPSIRRLTIWRSEFKKDGELVIDAPKLEYLHFMSCYFRRYSLMNPASLVEAHINNNRSDNVIQLLRCVSSIKILTLTRESLSALGLGGIRPSNLPMFPNLVKLEIAREWNPLLGLLSFISIWNLPNEEAPACLRFKLKEIFIVPNSTVEEFAVLSYLLKHANMLEKLTIGEKYSFSREQWLNIIPRVSESCRIEFV
ncbi:F-box/FBD/LRR-repeat protein At1g78750-like [Rutidosis leptorrhynchoides]|uniref:F-box/FBD/LRR-repeat protein At1g78750-like n=1 Tax=Rutidosis leptorrhynchoides TaxID=125765 RepID=UPI003A99DD70